MKTLYLSQDPALIDAQFTGTRLTPLQAQALRDDVSTDEITPVGAVVTETPSRAANCVRRASRCW